ncbi:hypothetical protein Aab01nite_21530 [Paractinoplanes abujensis]|uniref:Uncharacterized protein n=1 Tax=Paractinoplanes abujensis TaxID=882441 RepID=A0A7W7D0G2_9ACTN|nr:hypothetical protein [Actinoplanes abujensis]MBB4696965.1 hypothetical protein [Actinoplanes abujensis]GID18563.1 hypothetical protein Aab01nite_21530 [Actinoplanes abujensis]
MPIGNSGTLQIIAGVVLSMMSAYGGGRIHQWYMHGMDRDRAFREGYAHGYQALFHLAARGSRRVPRPTGSERARQLSDAPAD